MYIVEITEDKVDNIIEHMSKGLKCFNKAIECLEDARSGSHMNRRSSDAGSRIDDDFDDYDDYDDNERYGNRGMRRNRGGGRYSRY